MIIQKCSFCSPAQKCHLKLFVFTLLCSLILVSNLKALENVFFQPNISFGWKNYSNIELASQNMLENPAGELQLGFYSSGYLNPDLLTDINYNFVQEIFAEQDYGGFQNHNLNLGVYYDMLHNLNLCSIFDFKIFNDSVASDFNYNLIGLTPQINYHLNTSTSIGISTKHSQIEYTNVNKTGYYQKTGGFISAQLLDLFQVNLGLYGITDTALDNKGTSLDLGIFVPLFENDLFQVQIIKDALSYSDKTDNKLLITGGYSKSIIDGLNLNINFDMTNYDSSINDFDYESNIYTVSLQWVPNLNASESNQNLNNINMFYNAALEASEQGNYAMAEKQLRKTLLLMVDFPDAYYELGYALYKSEKYYEAIPVLEKTLLLSPENKNTYYLLAHCYYLINKLDKARKILDNI
ncbi:tetratricopeptide repeat protein [Candidatus Margulisiibacteriota bacterium]